MACTSEGKTVIIVTHDPKIAEYAHRTIEIEDGRVVTIMKDIFFDLSVRSVRLNFLRSLLASIGIVIGVVAISSMGMLGTNMQLSVKDQLSANVNTIMLTSDVVRMSTTPGLSLLQMELTPVSSTISSHLRGRMMSSRSTVPVRSLLSGIPMGEVRSMGLTPATSPNSSRLQMDRISMAVTRRW